MIPVHITKGFTLNIAGKPTTDIEMPTNLKRVAVLPEHISFVKPRLAVKEGDHVNIGSLLFVDKRNPAIQFLSPGGGIVERIDYGPRRVIKAIVIYLDGTETKEHFATLTYDALETQSRAELIEKIMQGGLWPLIRELPFRDIAHPEVTPPAILVRLSNMDPFHPEPGIYLKGQEGDFQYGLKVLRQLCDRISIYTDHARTDLPASIASAITHAVYGKYPADDPGAFVYRNRTSVADNRTWYISGQDLLLIAHLLKTGTYPTERIITLSGDGSVTRAHFKTRLGAPVSSFGILPADGTRIIAGGVLNGYTIPHDTYVGFHETALTVFSEGKTTEFLGFIRPGYKKPSFSHTFLSVFNKNEMSMDCNVHGEERACVNCGYCADICPVDILPQFTFKSVLVEEVEESLAHGLLDCTECGLCTYVCPSKIEICDILIAAKKKYYLDQAN